MVPVERGEELVELSGGYSSVILGGLLLLSRDVVYHDVRPRALSSMLHSRPTVWSAPAPCSTKDRSSTDVFTIQLIHALPKPWLKETKEWSQM